MQAAQGMANPEAQSCSLSTRVIYEYANKTNISWNIPEYCTPREYLDPLLIARQRDWEKQPKEGKDRRYRTKKGSFLDYHIKINKAIPGANAHNSQQPWSFKKQKAIAKHRSVDAKLKKGTFIDQIELEQEKRRQPGIGAYSLEKSMKQKEALVQKLREKKIPVGQRRFYHEDNDFIAGGLPGAGTYNPHKYINKVRVNKVEPKEMIKKHSDQNTRKTKVSQALPAPGTYKPMHATFTTFDSLQKGTKKNSNSLGKDARFEYTREDKKKIKEQRPDPSSYNTLYEWKGKKASMNRTLDQTISHGVKTLSVYH